MGESSWDETVVLDVEHLSSFTGGDPDFECQVLDIFLDNAPGYLALLRETEQENWKSTAHKLKGAARSIGAWRLARAGERAEFMGSPKADDPKRLQVLEVLGDRLLELETTIIQRKAALAC